MLVMLMQCPCHALCHALVVMILPCACHDIDMLLPCVCHAIAMLLLDESCYYHDIAMLLPCSCHVLAMLLPCSCPLAMPLHKCMRQCRQGEAMRHSAGNAGKAWLRGKQGGDTRRGGGASLVPAPQWRDAAQHLTCTSPQGAPAQYHAIMSRRAARQ
jgi:hypothetical protein